MDRAKLDGQVVIVLRKVHVNPIFALKTITHETTRDITIVEVIELVTERIRRKYGNSTSNFLNLLPSSISDAETTTTFTKLSMYRYVDIYIN